ncbi:hypothetical protein SAMN05216548_101549 [Faunimonas pinastri]|uniref:Uncharacterized protein n=1 Tax=Faunimonas pinastri TaxID=1855383 RepID=A0A1H9AYY1_9HYPH|nr:hypothetical protein [Faunimonas pinastri]SEP81198.1 hypothetical protein SAMN05216548_101549 [Faunimonas pinastri]
MPDKHSDPENFGGPGSSHQDRKHPEKSNGPGKGPLHDQSTRQSGVSGGGGEPDKHHSHDAGDKSGH